MNLKERTKILDQAEKVSKELRSAIESDYTNRGLPVPETIQAIINYLSGKKK
jgi:hypothetical protein